MDSRLRHDPENFFEVFVEVARPTEPTEDPFIIQRYPEDYSDEEALKVLPKFVFPCASESTTVDHFTFVLTDIDSRFRFCFCRHATGAQTGLCIVSWFPWFEVFYKLLNHLAELTNRSEGEGDVFGLLQTFHQYPIPTEQGELCEIVTPSLTEKFTFNIPNSQSLPTIPDNRNLTEYYNAIDTNNMMAIFARETGTVIKELQACVEIPDEEYWVCDISLEFFTTDIYILASVEKGDIYSKDISASDKCLDFSATFPVLLIRDLYTSLQIMLYERRVLIVSKKLSRLTACVHAAASLLYPMFWQHLYIPVLPPHLLDYCSAPMPYLIGVHSSLLQKLRLSELGDAVILDADKNIVQTQYDDLGTLPSDVVSALRKRLRGQGTDKHYSSMVGDWLARSFLKALVALIGGYRDALRFRPGESISFDEEAFLQSRPSAMRPFLENTRQLQTFEQFINGRLEMLNSGKGFSDEFEMENNMMGDKWGTKSRYKEWTNNMKKLQKGGKDRFVEFTGKMKDKSKKAYSTVRARIDELRDSPEKSPSVSPNTLRRGRPQTIPVSSLRPQRPPRPQNASLTDGITQSADGAMTRRPTDVNSRRYRLLELDGSTESHSPRVSKRQASCDDSAVDLPYNRVSLDLMQDQDIQAVFKKSYSLEDLTMVNEESEGSSDGERPGYRELQEAEESQDTVVVGRVQRSSTAMKRPVPAPRKSLHRESSVPVLTAKTSELDHQLARSTGNVYNNTTRPLVNNKSTTSLKTNSSEDSLENIRLVDTTSCDDSGAVKPRSTVVRTQAFKSSSRPVSMIRDSPVPQAVDANSISEARTEFMKTKSIPKSLNSSGGSLEDFDPLVTGQLVVDSKPVTSEKGGSDENLLRDWTGLDFTKKKPPSSTGGPPPPPKPATGYVNMMASRYNSTAPTAVPQMGLAARPPMMRALNSNHHQRPISMYSTNNPSFLHTVRQNYTGPQANLHMHSQAWPATRTMGQHTNTQASDWSAIQKPPVLQQQNTATHTNLQTRNRQGWPPPTNTSQALDPFSQVLQQTTVSQPPMMKPIQQTTPSVIAPQGVQQNIQHSQPTKQNGTSRKWETFE